MAKDPPNTQEPKKKGGNSAFQKFEELARKIVRVPKSQPKKMAGSLRTRNRL